MAEVLVPHEVRGSAETSRGPLRTKPIPVKSLGASAEGPGSGKPMISSTRIARRVHQLGRQISKVYADIETPLVMVVILKGATVFAADLLRSLSIPAELEFVRASSYHGGTSSSGRLQLAHMVDGPLVGREHGRPFEDDDHHERRLDVGVDIGDLASEPVDAPSDAC